MYLDIAFIAVCNQALQSLADRNQPGRHPAGRPLAWPLSRVAQVKTSLPLFTQAKYPPSRYRHKPRPSLNSSQQS